MRTYERTLIGAGSFVRTLKANVDNEKLTDEQFREFVRNTIGDVFGAEEKSDG